jgi:uncharacterized Zn finger protein (UPF0148 family)
MAEAVVEKEPCVKCGAEVREGTTFCYACGGRVAPDRDEDSRTETDINANAREALDDLARKLNDDDAAVQKKDQGDRIAKAAAERKKARVSQKRGRDFVWQPRFDVPISLLIAVVLIVIGAVIAVFVTVVWK